MKLRQAKIINDLELNEIYFQTIKTEFYFFKI